MDIHLDAGGLGVKMIDGTSKFLPESKRGFPSPAVAFYKAFGFSKLFPKSKRFNRYYLGNLEENANHEIEVLSGAFMLMRQTVLDQVGYLDEAFFMYGEDIDLSYRIVKEGNKLLVVIGSRALIKFLLCIQAPIFLFRNTPGRQVNNHIKPRQHLLNILIYCFLTVM